MAIVPFSISAIYLWVVIIDSTNPKITFSFQKKKKKRALIDLYMGNFISFSHSCFVSFFFFFFGHDTTICF